MTRDYTLPTSLGPCEKHGLTLRAGVHLDGNGNTIRGSRTKSSAGITLDEKSHGAVVRNLVVTGFERGIRLAGVNGARVEDVESHHNGDPVAHKGYGIDVARGASNTVIRNVHVHHNADEGIHIGNGARGNRVESSRFEDNYREQVYFLENDGNSLVGSHLSGGSASAVFVKHAKNVTVKGNTIEGRGIQVRGQSAGVRIEDNQLSGHGLTIQPYEKGPLGKTVPRDVVLSGGMVRSEQPCVRLIEARGVRLEKAGLACSTSISLDGDSNVTAVDTLVRRVRCSGPGRLTEQKTVHVKFVDGDGAGVSGVEVVDPNGIDAGVSGADGTWTGPLPVSTTRCPGPRTVTAGPAVLEHGTWSESRPVAELTGELRVGP